MPPVEGGSIWAESGAAAVRRRRVNPRMCER
jgi:hypothetical protein